MTHILRRLYIAVDMATLLYYGNRYASHMAIAVCFVIGISGTSYLFYNPARPSFFNRPLHFDSEYQYAAHPRWLIATMSRVESSTRRELIRNTWQTLYVSPVFETRFVIANYNHSLSHFIEHENRTHGDLVCLENVPQSTREAQTIMPVEYFKRIVAKAGSGGRTYDFVSKVDDDVFLVASKFFADFIAPRLHPTPATTTLIARWMKKTRKYPWPQGSFYTLSWDLILFLAESHTRLPIDNMPEDVMIGELLGRGKIKYDFVVLDDKRAFDFTDPNTHQAVAVTKDAIAPHMLKDDSLYRQVATLFNEDGFDENG